MNKPDINQHNTNPAYLKHLLLQAKLSKPEAAEMLGYTERSINLWLQEPDTKYRKEMPFAYQSWNSIEDTRSKAG